MVHPARFELATPWFEAKYSNPLSYGCVVIILPRFTQKTNERQLIKAGFR